MPESELQTFDQTNYATFTVTPDLLMSGVVNLLNIRGQMDCIHIHMSPILLETVSTNAVTYPGCYRTQALV